MYVFFLNPGEVVHPRIVYSFHSTIKTLLLLIHYLFDLISETTDFVSFETRSEENGRAPFCSPVKSFIDASGLIRQVYVV